MITCKYFCIECGTLFSKEVKKIDQYDPIFQVCPHCNKLKVLKVMNDQEEIGRG